MDHLSRKGVMLEVVSSGMVATKVLVVMVVMDVGWQGHGW